MPLHFDSFGATSPGKGRQVDEDSFLVDDPLRLYAVADGLGGYRAGDVASRTAVESVCQSLRAADLKSDGAIRAALAAAAEKAHQDIRRKAAADKACKGMRSTLVLLLIREPSYYFCNVGDSRGYVMRGEKLYQITKDHTPAFQMFLEGSVLKENIYVQPDSSLLNQSLGSSHDVAPDVFTGKTGKGDVFLLCSDGLTKELPEPQILKTLTHTWLPGTAARRLVDSALKAGGHDDITAVVVAG